MIDKNVPGQCATKEAGCYRKISKGAAETTASEHEEQERREEVSGRYEKRPITSERRETKTSRTGLFEPSNTTVSAVLPSAWAADVPPMLRIQITGVQAAGCADAGDFDFDGEYTLDLIDVRPEQCRWELTLAQKRHLYRVCPDNRRAAHRERSIWLS